MVNPGMVALGTAVSLGLLGNIVNDVSSTKYWYDYYHTYYIYSPQYTSVINDILMEKDGEFTKVGTKKIISGTQRIPGEGYHYYYATHNKDRRLLNGPDSLVYKCFYIGLEKIVDEDGTEYYVVWAPYTESGEIALRKFEEAILKPTGDQIRVISIDISNEKSRAEWMTKICRTPYPRQQKAMNFIIEKYTLENNFNVKVFLHGKRGVGKSYTSMLLKKHLDILFPNTNSRLYDDFDPTAIGVNIQTIALRHSTKNSPVIVIIDEIDEAYEQVFNEKEDFDPRLKHARNKKSFHKMLDNFGNFPYVIGVYTSEFGPDALVKKDGRYGSFLRPGRIDLVLEMTEDDCIVDQDYWERIKG